MNIILDYMILLQELVRSPKFFRVSMLDPGYAPIILQ